MARIIICGGRDFNDREQCFEALSRLVPEYENAEIVSGHARGADTFGEEFAKSHGLKLSVFKADWGRYGKAAGPIRNAKMYRYAAEEQPVIIAFWDGKSRGTKDMIRRGEDAGADVHIIYYKDRKGESVGQPAPF